VEAAVAAVHKQLKEAGIPHAFGGGFALAYYGAPRPTNDIDVNVFIAPNQWRDLSEVLGILEVEIEIDEAELERAGEVKLAWGSNFIHLFFSCDPLHEEMRQGVRSVPFDGDAIPLISPEHLLIRKALLDRTKDWIDIEQILVATSPLDLQEVEAWLEQMAGIDDPRMEKLREIKSSLSLA